MLFVENDQVFLTRGDDAVLEVSLTAAGKPYEMQPGDVLQFTARKLPSVDSPVLVRVQSETPRIVLRHEDTKDLAVGQYSADVQLMTGDGKRITVWPILDADLRSRVTNWRNMIIMPEVTTE